MVPNVDNTTQLADGSFSNGTIDWEINYKQPIGTGNIPVSSYYRNITFWSDPATTLQRSNDTHNVNIDSGEVFRINLKQEDYFFDWDTLAPGTIISQDFDYQLIVPPSFNDQQAPEFFTTQTVNAIIQNASSQDAYTIAKTLSDFLRLGNETFSFDLFHTPTSRVRDKFDGRR